MSLTTTPNTCFNTTPSRVEFREEYPLTEYLTEQEQIALLKNWIRQYSVVIIAGVLIAMLAITGWRYWQQRQERILSHASAVYDEMLTMRAQRDTAATIVQASKLFSHYTNTTYGQLAAFMLAREAILIKNYLEAEKQLRWVLENSSVASLRQVARLRLARVYLTQQQPQKALDILNEVEDKGFNGLINEIKGDAYLAMKNAPQARTLYKEALAELPNAEVVRPLLQMKYDNLAGIKEVI